MAAGADDPDVQAETAATADADNEDDAAYEDTATTSHNVNTNIFGTTIMCATAAAIDYTGDR